ncbi:multidrug effflux MFS transporter [Clavibacter sepedonicus]|uniref:multidrug effflux MFS transporter n=1 Tax=Clavibacter TaxID=1573 RepID=UPI0002FA760C|nr:MULTISPECIES: multidrug effflux MFS transporter [Clavibacter]MBD5382051.1 multidrug effflux MFS transporter [Clavibacter sp.]OQJ48731.1 Bcr/CflA family drug resistance efflux transporter [Clavibacter sepedonicus]UUK65822.1 multidrug effflux MFS transporter [Clavibacter sepedonicus]
MSSAVLHPGDALSRRERIVYIIVLGALVGLGPFTIDLYLPAFPVIKEQFGVSDAAVQLTLTGTTVGFALGQLVVGPWSDRVGRRLPLIVATSLHILASLGAALAPDVTVLLVFRILQGAGAAGGAVVAMAMVRDLFGGRPLVRMLSRLALVTGLAPILAPVIGSQLLRFVDWRGVFYALTAYAILVVIAVTFFIVETLPKDRVRIEEKGTLLRRYRSVLGDRVFVGVALIGGMQFAGLFSYLSSSSFLFQDVYGFDAQQFGILFGINSLGVVIGNQIAARLTKVIGPQWILAGVVTVQFLSSATIVLLGTFTDAGLLGTLIPLFFFILACGFGFPCVQVLGLVNHGHEAGTAASLLGAVNFGLAGAISPIVGLIGITSGVPMAVVMGACAVVSILSMWLIVQPRTVPALTN